MFGSPWGNYFTPSLVCSQHTVPRNIKLAQTLSGYQFTPWSSGTSKIYFLCPEKFTLGQCRNRTTDLSICSQTRYHWTNTPHYITCCIIQLNTFCFLVQNISEHLVFQVIIIIKPAKCNMGKQKNTY